MTGASDELLLLAENPNSFTPLGPGSDRVVRDGFVLWLGSGSGAGWTVAQRFRLREDEVEPALAEIRALVRQKGRTACSWEVGSLAAPPDLVGRLLELGLVPGDEPLQIGMVLTEEPAAALPGIEARKASSPEDFRRFAAITAEAFGMDADPDEPGGWAAAFASSGHGAVWLAFLDGEPVAAATSTYTDWGVVLNAGSTLPAARGRGAYRALVHARWQDAVARGTPALVTQAGAMSRPILERLGFQAVCEIHALLDELDAISQSSFCSGAPPFRESTRAGAGHRRR